MVAKVVDRDLYLDFVQARHDAYLHRLAGLEPPWTDDPVVRERKFTNVFRLLDYGSQFVAEELMWSDAPDEPTALMRAAMYRYNNRAEPWIFFKDTVGRYPLLRDLYDGTLARVWSAYKADGNPIFGTAYRMFVGKENAGMTRLDWIISMIHTAFRDTSLTAQWERADTVKGRVLVLESNLKRCGDFMAMQIVTDMGYSPYPVQTENSHILAGPGCRVGARQLEMDPYDAISWAWNRPEVQSLRFPGINRPPSLMDIQNTFCEFGKYVRYYRAGPTGRIYRPAHAPKLPEPFYPPHWKN